MKRTIGISAFFAMGFCATSAPATGTARQALEFIDRSPSVRASVVREVNAMGGRAMPVEHEDGDVDELMSALGENEMAAFFSMCKTIGRDEEIPPAELARAFHFTESDPEVARDLALELAAKLASFAPLSAVERKNADFDELQRIALYLDGPDRSRFDGAGAFATVQPLPVPAAAPSATQASPVASRLKPHPTAATGGRKDGE